ncbi:Uronyl 2-sulfotransferase [Bagarius yarrelli]|uniref:Uronyl 2-sulfotransferase n=1 Tax=Bagarius yarrelli TaxID=175774 RepID=A0A556TZH5_BAGYA|nr:Uronyl 2-sulfotransferase [Bagarius yarrelli]
MKNPNGSPRLNHHQPANHTRDRNGRKGDWLSALWLRFSLRNYGFCMGALLLFSLGSLFYQLNGGPPRFLLDIRQYLGYFRGMFLFPTSTERHISHIRNPLSDCTRTSGAEYNLFDPRNLAVFIRLYSGESTFMDDHGPPVPKVELMKNISTVPQPFLYTRHVHFLNFSRFRMEQPVYINIIRDPINRFLSNYFFRRFGDWRGEQNHLIRTPRMKDDERYLRIRHMLAVGRGSLREHVHSCSSGSEQELEREPGVWALERAKQNVMENFLLVGILEELEDVLLLLERLLPHYFSDVLSIYHSPAFWKVGNLTGTVKKHMPTLEALQVLYRRMRYEYDFYNFVRDQFHLIKKKIGLKSSHPSSVLERDFLRELALRTNDPLDEDDEDEEDDTALEDANNWLVQP